MSIDEALVKIQEAAQAGQYFSIAFVVADGRIVEYPQARYGADDNYRGKKERLKINEREGTAHRGVRKVSLLRDDGGVPITKMPEGELKTPKWYSILKLNNEDVN